ncbi:hypothetical protein FBU59_001761 [Linderina macrospora]|uniref:Uncharacterized protein n=1 Tax=Linderina macrospora TaxID=4868 RepID=A0ACC1JD87_9FUNG|nr:hypothetical protein FBU59_001761 [Linderina macrospora]
MSIPFATPIPAATTTTRRLLASVKHLLQRRHTDNSAVTKAIVLGVLRELPAIAEAAIAAEGMGGRDTNAAISTYLQKVGYIGTSGIEGLRDLPTAEEMFFVETRFKRDTDSLDRLVRTLASIIDKKAGHRQVALPCPSTAMPPRSKVIHRDVTTPARSLTPLSRDHNTTDAPTAPSASLSRRYPEMQVQVLGRKVPIPSSDLDMDPRMAPDMYRRLCLLKDASFVMRKMIQDFSGIVTRHRGDRRIMQDVEQLSYKYYEEICEEKVKLMCQLPASRFVNLNMAKSL